MALHKAKPQANIIVKRSDKKRATWHVKITHMEAGYFPGPITCLLPGDFTHRWMAQEVANLLADCYGKSGCNVALDLSGRH